MIILSFDVGIKNMAYCIVKFNEKTDNNHTILKWGIINCAENILNNNLKCCVSRKGILCNKDACNQVSINDTILGFCNLKTCQKELNTNYSNKNIKKVTKKTTKDISLKDLGDVLFNELNNIPLTDIDCIVIEMSSTDVVKEENNETRYEYGLIAQEVDKILKESDPESTIVSEDNEGFLGMDYKQIIMPLIKSIQELNIEIEKLKKELELLKQSK